MGRDQRADRLHVRCRDPTSAVLEYEVHGRGLVSRVVGPVPSWNTITKYFKRDIATGRHSGRALVACGSPPRSSTCSSWACSVDAGPVSVGQKPKRPLESRLWYSQKPWPSYASTLMTGRPRLQKTKAVPENGSTRRAALHWVRKAIDPAPEFGSLDPRPAPASAA
jgi:hypothetical protein